MCGVSLDLSAEDFRYPSCQVCSRPCMTHGIVSLAAAQT